MPDSHDGEDTTSDPLAAIRDEVEQLDALPVADRVPRFEHANEVLAAELARLDEV